MNCDGIVTPLQNIVRRTLLLKFEGIVNGLACIRNGHLKANNLPLISVISPYILLRIISRASPAIVTDSLTVHNAGSISAHLSRQCCFILSSENTAASRPGYRKSPYPWENFRIVSLPA